MTNDKLEMKLPNYMGYLLETARSYPNKIP